MTFQTVAGDAAIHCAGCEQRINSALRRPPGVRDVQASATSQQIRVVYEPNEVTEDDLLARLERVGFSATAQTSGS